MSVAEEMFGIRKQDKRPRPRAADSRPPKPDGVSREVYMLTGGVNPASLMPTTPVSALQHKPVQRRAWIRKQFLNSARTDGLQLGHWVRVGEPEGAYPFAKFSKPIRMITYTDEEYAAVVDALVPLGPTKPHMPNPEQSLPLLTQSAAGSPPVGADPHPAGSVNALGFREASNPRASSKGSLRTTSPILEEGALTQPDMQTRSSPTEDMANLKVQADSLTVTQDAGELIMSPRKRNAASQPPFSSPAASGNAQEQPLKRKAALRDPTDSDIGAVVGIASASDERAVAVVGSAMSPVSGPSGIAKKSIHFVPPQMLWTRAETDALFALCKEFDLRFPVIHDRWPSKFAVRSIDELKDRYYGVAKAVLEYRTRVDKAALTKLPVALQKHAQAINMNPFDYEYECIRKNQLERQYKRSKEELREEEETVRSARRIEANQKRLKKERERLAKLLTPAGDILMTAPDGSRVVDAKVAAAAIAANQPQKVFPHRKVNSGAFARSSQIYTPVTQSSRLAKRVDQVLEELKVGTRPTPTTYVVDNFDLLRMDILSFLELHRTVLRKEEETHHLRVRLAKLKGHPPPLPPPALTSTNKRRKVDEALDPAVAPLLFSN